MTGYEFKTLVALIWGHHGGQQQAARHFGVRDRTVRRWAAGDTSVPDAVAEELRRLAARAPLPIVTPPPAGTTWQDDRDDDAASAIEPAYRALVNVACWAGWSEPEILAALLSWVVIDMRKGAGDEATRKTLASAIIMMDE